MRSFNEEQSVVSLVNALIGDAIECAASDIHLEPTESMLRVRFRLDGVLHGKTPIKIDILPQFISRLKVLANINITQKRMPQDGKFQINYKNKLVDLRISTFPSLYGEKVVIRILDRHTHAISVDQVGFSPEMLRNFLPLMKRPSGFFLVTGPTGSGKTTTLYSVLSLLNCPEKNIVTLEDPVEYNVDGVTQGYINTQAGFTFEAGIRSLLRQDPDILMVGEIRDKQTARVAIEAALTGHLVLSTLHTNDAPSAIVRLMDMGIEPFLINASLTGVLAQRLVRKICIGCKQEYVPSPQELVLCHQLGMQPDILYRGAGCDSCNNLGYKGRTGIFELLTVTNGLRELIIKNPIFEALYARACVDGMATLMQDGADKVVRGVITLDELMRVVA